MSCHEFSLYKIGAANVTGGSLSKPGLPTLQFQWALTDLRGLSHTGYVVHCALLLINRHTSTARDDADPIDLHKDATHGASC